MVDNVTVIQADDEPLFIAIMDRLSADPEANPAGANWRDEMPAVRAMWQQIIKPIVEEVDRYRLSPAPEGVDARELLAAEYAADAFAVCDGDSYLADRDRAALRAIEAALALSRPPAEQVRMREALENIAGHDAGANGLEGFAAGLVDQLAATARAALTPPPKGQNDGA